MKDVQATGEAFSHHKRTSSTSKKEKEIQSGSKSTTLRATDQYASQIVERGAKVIITVTRT
jgi:hypothetical protein